MSNYICFWGPKGSYGEYSQWYLSDFTVDNITYNCCEQYMMYHKALLFNDLDIAMKILQETSPRKLKALGRQIKNFDETIWEQHRADIVYNGNLYKFSQNLYLKKKMLKKLNYTFIEASPYDRIWGVGYTADNLPLNKELWGLNLLGVALNKVQKTLMST
jgi:ribA/ribD-fused uncharacterized protein